MEENQDFYDWVRDIQRSGLPEIDRLKEFFGRVTARIVDTAKGEIELARAMHDADSVVKGQIKRETVQTARSVFAQGYQIVTGRKAWDDSDQC